MTEHHVAATLKDMQWVVLVTIIHDVHTADFLTCLWIDHIDVLWVLNPASILGIIEGGVLTHIVITTDAIHVIIADIVESVIPHTDLGQIKLVIKVTLVDSERITKQHEGNPTELLFLGDKNVLDQG